LNLSSGLHPDVAIPVGGHELLTISIEDALQSVPEFRRANPPNSATLEEELLSLIDSPTVGGFCLVQNTATNGPIKVMRNRPQILEFIVRLEEAAEGLFAFAGAALPTVSE
jgi:hypothetical protein